MSESLKKLIEVMHQLYKPGGCPWDREQTHESLIPFAIEETYEVIDAIEKKDMISLREELGDLLLQVVFHAEIASESKLFNIDDVAQGIADKLIRRHPHVFGNVTAETSTEVLQNWDQIKADEKKQQGKGDLSVLESIPQSLPSLMQAFKISKQASKMGFDWNKPEDVLLKVNEEIEELAEAAQKMNSVEMEEEFGDLLFSLTNYARHLKIDPEQALRKTNQKFRKRFGFMERKIASQNKKMSDYTLPELENLWIQAKIEG